MAHSNVMHNIHSRSSTTITISLRVSQALHDVLMQVPIQAGESLTKRRCDGHAFAVVFSSPGTSACKFVVSRTPSTIEWNVFIDGAEHFSYRSVP